MQLRHWVIYTSSRNVNTVEEINFDDLWCTFVIKVEMSLKINMKNCVWQGALFVVVPCWHPLYYISSENGPGGQGETWRDCMNGIYAWLRRFKVEIHRLGVVTQLNLHTSWWLQVPQYCANILSTYNIYFLRHQHVSQFYTYFTVGLLWLRLLIKLMDSLLIVRVAKGGLVEFLLGNMPLRLRIYYRR